MNRVKLEILTFGECIGTMYVDPINIKNGKLIDLSVSQKRRLAELLVQHGEVALAWPGPWEMGPYNPKILIPVPTLRKRIGRMANRIADRLEIEPDKMRL